ncbi:MAG: hypothetical protein HGB11_07205 [Chlorobiales bacterium]|nr:hypothetical protein [Chlorobiales bacterium]
MRLDFNVLWVEDQQSRVQSQSERINTMVNKEGFRLQVKFASSVDEATGYLSDSIYGDHIDLILMDYDLGAGGRGDDGLEQVRFIFPYKDIIFYSSQAPDLSDMVAKKKVQGVYCSTRDDLPDTVVGAFEALVKKVLDIDHSRGIVMGATSDIDQYVNECLIAVFDGSSEEIQKTTLAVLKKHLTEKRKSFDKEATLIEAVKHVDELFKMHNVYTSNDRLRLLKNAIKINGIHADKAEVIQRYLTDTVPRRNLLAHVRVEVNGFSRKLIDGSGNELTNKDMKSLRQELLMYQDFIETLSIELKSATVH